jgi:hypothetical protein
MDLLCAPLGGNDSWYSVWQNCRNSCDNVPSQSVSLCFQSCGNTLMNCALFDFSGVGGIDTVYVNQGGGSDFYEDFNNSVSNPFMISFLFSVMVGILAIRVVVDVIKSAVR